MNHHSHHSFAARERARKAKETLGDQSDWEKAFVYDAFLNVMQRGVRPMGRDILKESAKLGQKAKADYEARFGEIYD